MKITPITVHILYIDYSTAHPQTTVVLRGPFSEIYLQLTHFSSHAAYEYQGLHDQSWCLIILAQTMSHYKTKHFLSIL